MQILPIDKDRYVKVDGDKAEVFYLTEVEKCLKEATARLAELPTQPTDEELLEWARENYPAMDYSAEKQSLEAKISECNSILEAIK